MAMYQRIGDLVPDIDPMAYVAAEAVIVGRVPHRARVAGLAATP